MGYVWVREREGLRVVLALRVRLRISDDFEIYMGLVKFEFSIKGFKGDIDAGWEFLRRIFQYFVGCF